MLPESHTELDLPSARVSGASTSYNVHIWDEKSHLLREFASLKYKDKNTKA
jgi:hypothetical protein